MKADESLIWSGIALLLTSSCGMRVSTWALLPFFTGALLLGLGLRLVMK